MTAKLQDKVAIVTGGGTGIGKSHLAQALGHCAARQGRDVLFISQTELLKKLHDSTKKLKDLLVITKLSTVFDSFDTEAAALESYGA